MHFTSINVRFAMNVLLKHHKYLFESYCITHAKWLLKLTSIWFFPPRHVIENSELGMLLFWKPDVLHVWTSLSKLMSRTESSVVRLAKVLSKIWNWRIGPVIDTCRYADKLPITFCCCELDLKTGQVALFQHFSMVSKQISLYVIDQSQEKHSQTIAEQQDTTILF